MTTLDNVPRTPAGHGHFFWLVGTWIAVYFGSRMLLELPGLGVPARVLIAVVPVLVFALVFYRAVVLIRRADELEQRIHLLAAAAAFPVVAMIVLLLGLLDRAAILSRSSLTDVWPLFTSGYVIAYVFARRHYHPAPDAALGTEE